MKKDRVSFWIVLGMILALPLLASSAAGGDVLETVGNGTINWSSGVVQGTGIGAPPENLYGKPSARPMALRAAKLDALRNILEVVNGVRIDSTSVVRDFAVDSDVITAKVQGMVRGAQEVKKEYLSDGTVEVTMQVSIYGGFAQLMLPRDIKQVEPITPVKPLAPAPAPSTPAAQTPPAVLTGLVIDARGLNARPAMAPKVLDEAGQEVYGSAFVSREYAVQQGMSGYAKDIEAARSNARVADNPLVLRGLRTEGAGRCDIVISNADAARVRSASEHLSFMKKCRIMMVVD